MIDDPTKLIEAARERGAKALAAWGIRIREKPDKFEWKSGGTRNIPSIREIKCRDCKRKMGEFRDSRIVSITCYWCAARAKRRSSINS